MNRSCMNQNQYSQNNCQNQNNNQNTCQNPSRNMGQSPAYQRGGSANRTPNGSCVQNTGRNAFPAETKIPNGCRAELLRFINEVSFAAYEAMLYLDTHPDCQEALQYFRKNNELRARALKIHAESYGPLMLSPADETGCSSWEWMMQPWPWELEGGAC